MITNCVAERQYSDLELMRDNSILKEPTRKI